MTPYMTGHVAALTRYKLAGYLSEEDKLHRMLRHHMAQGGEAERRRLGEEGEASGRDSGRFGGALLGTLLGAGVGGVTMGPLGALGGGAAGFAGGRHLGGNWGAASGRRSGEQEADDRQELAEHVQAMSPEEMRKHIEHVISSRRAADALALQREGVDAQNHRNSIEQQRLWSDIYRD